MEGEKKWEDMKLLDGAQCRHKAKIPSARMIFQNGDLDDIAL